MKVFLLKIDFLIPSIASPFDDSSKILDIFLQCV